MVILSHLENEAKRIARIVGPSGFGKSRFAYEIFNQLDSQSGQIENAAMVYAKYAGDDQIRMLALEISWLPIIFGENDDLTWHPALQDYVTAYHSIPGVLDVLKFRLITRTLIEAHSVELSLIIQMLEKWIMLPEPALKTWAEEQMLSLKSTLFEARRDDEEMMVRINRQYGILTKAVHEVNRWRFR